MNDRLLTRRTFLVGLSGAGATLLAACLRVLPTPSAATPTMPPASAALPSTQPTPAPTPSGPSLRSKIGQMLLVGFRGTDEATSAAVLNDIRQHGLGGVVLFSVDQPTGSPVRNIVSPEQLAGLTAALQDAVADANATAARPLLIAVDQEGGQVARLGPDHGFPPTVSAAELGAQDNLRVTRDAGRNIAMTLSQAGINLNLAPVVDLNLNPTNPIIGALDRSFGTDPDLVHRQAAAFIRGHHQVGVLTTLKHFPGHGSASGDTHLGVVDVTDSWQPIELQPFAAVIGDGLADAVLTAHVFNARLDPDHPATLSAPTIDGILRDRLGWDGVVISDDMQMGAIRDAYGYPDAVRLAIEAGVDILTIANQQVFEEGIVARTIDLIAGLVEEGRISEARIDESFRRISALKQRIAGG